MPLEKISLTYLTNYKLEKNKLLIVPNINE